MRSKKSINTSKGEEYSGVGDMNKLAKVKLAIKKLGIIKSVSIVVTLVLAVVFLSSYLDTKNKLSTLQANSVVASSKDGEMVAKIRTYFDLPTENPQVQTIGDLSKLSKDDFFNRAKKGDKVLIFAQAKRAMLYRPSSGKIIEYSVIN